MLEETNKQQTIVFCSGCYLLESNGWKLSSVSKRSCNPCSKDAMEVLLNCSVNLI